MGLATSSGPARTHAAPTELGGACGRCNYKHGAPSGAFCIAVAAPTTCKRPCKVQQLAGAFDRCRTPESGSQLRAVLLRCVNREYSPAARLFPVTYRAKRLECDQLALHLTRIFRHWRSAKLR